MYCGCLVDYALITNYSLGSTLQPTLANTHTPYSNSSPHTPTHLRAHETRGLWPGLHETTIGLGGLSSRSTSMYSCHPPPFGKNRPPSCDSACRKLMKSHQRHRWRCLFVFAFSIFDFAFCFGSRWHCDNNQRLFSSIRAGIMHTQRGHWECGIWKDLVECLTGQYPTRSADYATINISTRMKI